MQISIKLLNVIYPYNLLIEITKSFYKPVYAIILTHGKVGLMSTMTTNCGLHEPVIVLHTVGVRTVLSNTPQIFWYLGVGLQMQAIFLKIQSNVLTHNTSYFDVGL